MPAPSCPQRPFRSLILIAIALAAFPGLRARAQTDTAQDSWPSELEAAVSRERVLQSLTPVQSSAALRKAAQAHAEDMARNGYFAIEGPPGSPTIESLLDSEGYHYTLMTEKLVRAPVEQSVENLTAGWRTALEANRSTLFLAGAREIGAGVVENGEARIIAIVLATGSDTSEAEAKLASFSALARDPAAAGKALGEAIAEQRRAWGLSPLRVDVSLGESAVRHAQDLLAAQLANRPTDEVVSLADLVADQRARAGAPVEVSGEVSRQRRHASRGTNTLGDSVGEVIVTDASSPEEALATALQQKSLELHDQRYRVIAVGLAVRPPASLAEAGRSVWVIALATH